VQCRSTAGRVSRRDADVAASTGRRISDVGAVIMLGTLVGLIALIFGLVLRFDPEARAPSGERRADGD
jgi:hypothetical protein